MPAFVGDVVDDGGGHEDSEALPRVAYWACRVAPLTFWYWQSLGASRSHVLGSHGIWFLVAGHAHGDERPLVRAAVRDSIRLTENQAAAGVRHERL